MDQTTIAAAVSTLKRRRLGFGAPVADLGQIGPASVADGHLIQDALIAALSEGIGGWKVAGTEPTSVMRGAVMASRLLPSGSTIAAIDAPWLGIEAEIAFRIDTDLPAHPAWTREELAPHVTALPAIEIVATRFADYNKAPLYHRLADMMSNGFLIVGEPNPAWRSLDLESIGVELRFDRRPVRSGTGGHPAIDPLLPALALVNSDTLPPLRAGQIVTTGTYTGLLFAEPGMNIAASFEGLGTAGVSVAH